MKPLELLRRAAGKSPAYLARRAALEAKRALGARRLRRRLACETAKDVAARAGARSLEEIWEKSSAARLAWPSGEIPALRAAYEGRWAPERARLARDVEGTLAHEFDLLGSGPVALGAEIDWHRDFKSGVRFPADVPAGRVDYAQLDRPSDVKVPWELSRGQHLTRLAQAWVVFGDARAPREFEAQVRSWIAANPPGLGVNWACTMDVALRSVSWIWALALFSGAPFAPDFRETVLLSLWRHALWVPAHLEMGEVNGNHYLSDAVGLVALGAAFDATPEGRAWRDAGARILEEEILAQTSPDGAGIEGSVPYHRLVVELFLVGRRLLEVAGRPVPAAFDARLEKALEFVEAYVTPEGLSPVVGDADDGRAIVLGREGVRDHRALLSAGAILFRRGSFRARAARLHEETLWLLGPAAAAAWDALADAPPSGTRAFPDAGFYVLRTDGQYLFVDAGPVGFKGRGGHGHNDCLSFEWHARGRPVLTDSGAYVYTASVEWRNRFRSTAFHNAIAVDGEEINRFPSPLALWALRNDAAPVNVTLRETADGAELAGGHTGFRRLTPPVDVERRFRVEAGRARLVVEDRIAGRGAHVAEFFFHAAPGWSGRSEAETLILSFEGDPARVTLRASIRGLAWSRRDGWFSPSYGIKVPRETWVARIEGPLPVEVAWEITAAG